MKSEEWLLIHFLMGNIISRKELEIHRRRANNPYSPNFTVEPVGW